MVTVMKSKSVIGVLFVVLVAGLLLAGPARSFANDPVTAAKRLPTVDQQYLRQLAQDTWNCIDYLVDKNSQIPYDNTQKGEYTSVTNIGLYVASIVAAVDMGFLDRKDARARLESLLENLGQFTQWNGFTQSWNNVHTGRPAMHDPWISTLDSGNYYAGLMVGRAYFPELSSKFSKLIDVADWSKLYNPQADKLRFGYNRIKDTYNGNLDDLGSDARLAYFIAVAKGKIPATSWLKLNREMEERYGMQYLQPGWQGGGLFMQFISGLFLDEADTFLGVSAANFAYAQILHARNKAYPVWGWSACAAPTGEYLGMGALKDEVVTPHASVLAIKYYPTLVLANLKALEDMGARKLFRDKDYGFRDSINIRLKSPSDNYLVLDQCMLFLSLANFLDNDIVINNFKKDGIAKKGYKLIDDLKPINALATLRSRDGNGIPHASIAEADVKVKPYIERFFRVRKRFGPLNRLSWMATYPSGRLLNR